MAAACEESSELSTESQIPTMLAEANPSFLGPTPFYFLSNSILLFLLSSVSSTRRRYVSCPHFCKLLHANTDDENFEYDSSMHHVEQRDIVDVLPISDFIFPVQSCLATKLFLAFAWSMSQAYHRGSHTSSLVFRLRLFGSSRSCPDTAPTETL